jgi:hypothetical protein
MISGSLSVKDGFELNRDRMLYAATELITICVMSVVDGYDGKRKK